VLPPKHKPGQPMQFPHLLQRSFATCSSFRGLTPTVEDDAHNSYVFERNVRLDNR
jgi:hypothetical protein